MRDLTQRQQTVRGAGIFFAVIGVLSTVEGCLTFIAGFVGERMQ